MPLFNPVQNIVTYLAGLMSNNTPASETTSGGAGAGSLIPRQDHTHPRLTSADVVQVASGSTVKIAFTRTFTKQPSVVPTLIETDAGASQQPVLFAVIDWLGSDGITSVGINPADGVVIGGCTMKAWRTTPIPQNLVTLLAGAIWSIWGGSVTGIRFSYVALASSRP